MIQKEAVPSTDDMRELVNEAARENHEFVGRLMREWRSGENRFEAEGEAFFVARAGEQVVGICGLNRDPYVDDVGTGRLRRLYVLPSRRRTGVARKLVKAALAHAAECFDTIRVRAGTPQADGFYESLDFTPTSEDSVTHRLTLRERTGNG